MLKDNLDKIISLCKRRGFVFQSSDIYGGLQGIYDYGPLGVELKNNLKNAWWRSNVYERDDVEGLDSAIISNKLVFHYSGHEETFSDLMIDCLVCKKRWRADHLEKMQCEACGSKELTEPRPFNLMLKTNLGPISNNDSFGYLRPETAQGIFTNFKNIVDSMSPKLPFGIAQIGKAFRNEITPKNFTFRVREFEQMELEFFVKPGDDEEWHNNWVEWRLNWWVEQGLSKKNLKLVEQSGNDLAHYAKRTVDILYKFPHGYEEIEGIANRTDFDLGNHSKNQTELNLSAQVKENIHSNAKLTILDKNTQKHIVPYVIEPSAGVDRGILALLCEAYTEEMLDNNQSRIVLKFNKKIAPIKLAIIPLVRNNSDIVACAQKIKNMLLKLGLGKIDYEDNGNIGKAYRKHDEIGTPLCITVDFETIEESVDDFNKKTVTIRERDSMTQFRLEIGKLIAYVRDFYE